MEVSARKRPGEPQGDAPRFVDRAPGSRRRYTREEVIATIRRCAKARGRRPTWTTFDGWAVGERARVRGNEGPTALPRIPSWRVFRRLWPNGNYAAAVRAAALADEELRVWRTQGLGVAPPAAKSAAETISELTDGRLLGAGLSEDGLAALSAGGPAALPIPEAARLAAALDGTLHWLAGMTPDPGGRAARRT